MVKKIITPEIEMKTKMEILLEDMASLESYGSELFSFIPLPTVFVNPQGVILETNPAFEELTNKSFYEIVGKPIESFFVSKDMKKILKETFQKGNVKDRETYFLDKKNKLVPISIFSQVRISGEKQVIGCFLSIFDLTEIKKSEEKLEESKKVLEIKVEARIRELKELAESLEQKVEERTEELEKKLEELELMNKLMVGRELKMVELKERLREAEIKISKLKK